MGGKKWELCLYFLPPIFLPTFPRHLRISKWSGLFRDLVNWFLVAKPIHSDQIWSVSYQQAGTMGTHAIGGTCHQLDSVKSSKRPIAALPDLFRPSHVKKHFMKPAKRWAVKNGTYAFMFYRPSFCRPFPDTCEFLYGQASSRI